MQSINNSRFRIISVIVLAFYLWTFGGIFELAYAFKTSSDKAQRTELGKQKEQGPGERLNKAIEEIEQIIQAVQTVQTVEEKRAGKERLQTKELEIEALDKEIRKQFSETETRIKDLPDIIKQRHREFVSKYEENLKELKNNLEAIKKHDIGSREFEEAVKKTKAHLEKVKPRKRHIPLDPNKLPHRTAEPTKKKPRLRPEQFSIEHSAEGIAQRFQSKEHGAKSITQRYEPILVASNGSLTGLLSPASEDYGPPLPLAGEGWGEGETPNSELSTSGLLLAAADPPTDADLAETIEVQFTGEIKQLAADLEYKPLRIYEFVRNNFETEPYYGSLKGAQQTLLERAGNDFDQASLLISLLRASNIPARYVYGTVEIPIEKLMNWVGGVTDPNTAAQIMATNGVPGQLITEGGQIKYAQMEHVWVEVYVPYGNYRGALRDNSIKTWIPLDPSFKQYEYKRGMDLYTAMGINGEQYIYDYITDDSPSPIPPELEELFPDYTISPYQYYSQKLKAYLDANIPNYDLEEILGDVEGFLPNNFIIPQNYPFFLGSLPYKVIIKGIVFSSISDNLRHKITIQLRSPATSYSLEEIDFTYKLPASKWINHRITLSYKPATKNDETLVNQYGDLLNVPPYLINVKAALKIDGDEVASGNPTGLGYDQILNITFTSPNQKSDVVENAIITGTYAAITIVPSKVRAEFSGRGMEQLLSNLHQVPSENVDLDDVLGEMLHNIGLTYFGQLSFQESLYASTFQVLVFRQPSEAIVASNVSVEYLFDIPSLVEEGGISIDVDRNQYITISIAGDETRTKDFMIISGITSSAWENEILEFMYDVPSVSAIKLLRLSALQEIAIHTIDKDNISQTLPLLQISQTVKSSIQNAVNAGKKVIVPQSNIQYLDWYGTGYIVLDPVTGAGAYMLSNELSGGWSGAKLPESSRDINALFNRLCPNARERVLRIASGYLGTPYVDGGKVLDAECSKGGFDCSGLVGWVYKLAGYPQIFWNPDPRYSDKQCFGVNAETQYTLTKHTDYPLIADLVFFSHTDSPEGIGHVGIIIAKDMMIDAFSTESPISFEPFSAVRWWRVKYFFGYLIESCNTNE